MKVSIIIPAYNEAGTLAEIVRRVKAVPLGSHTSEIIVVDNNSSDDTFAIASNIEGVRVLKEPVPGKGSAVRTGFKNATGDILLIQDADLEYDPNDIPSLIAPIAEGRADAVTGIRKQNPRTKKSQLYSLGNVAITFATNLLYGGRAREYTGGYKVFSRQTIESIPVHSNDFAYEHELLCKVLKTGKRLVDLPIEYHPRTENEGKKINWKDGFKILWAVITYRFVDTPMTIPTRNILIYLLALTILTGGGSILYLKHTAESAGTPYPIPENTMSQEYATLTKNLVQHGVFSFSSSSPYVPDVWRTPGYPVFMAPFMMVFNSFYSVLIIQVLVLFATVVLIFLMARSLMNERWAFGLSAVYLLLPDTMLSVATILSENIFVFCLTLAIYLCFFSKWKNMYVRWAVAGFLLALTAYIRPASLYILVFFIPGYLAVYARPKDWKRHVLSVVLLAVVFVGTLLPWYVRNQQAVGTFSFASTGPYVLFRQNATQFYEAYMHIPNLEARYALEDMAGVPRGPVPTELSHSKALLKVALEVIGAHPFEYAVFHLTTFIPFFTSSGAHDYWFFTQTLNPTFNPEPEPSLIQALHPFSLPTLLVVLGNHGWTLLENALWGLATLLVLIGLWRSRDTRLARIFFVLMLYFATVTGPIAHARYRIPVEPFILISAFSTAYVLVEVYKKRKNQVA